MQPILQFEGVSKRFGQFKAIHQFEIEIAEGEVVGLTGLTGSGKSVVAQLIAGLHTPTEGRILYKGNSLHRDNPEVEVIHQVPALVNTMSVTMNVFLGRELFIPLIGHVLHIPDQPRMEVKTRRALQTFLNTGIELDEIVSNLSAEQRQIVAISRALVGSPQLIVLDDVTESLNYTNQQQLLSLIQAWRQENITVLFCSSNLDHLFAVTDRIFVMQQGMIVGSCETDETSHEEIVSAMVGYDRSEKDIPAILALDSYYRARQRTNQLYQQSSLLKEQIIRGQTDSLHQQLLAQLSKQVRALDQANGALQNAQRRLLTEREGERKHLARELHDQVIQDLLSVSYELEAISSDDGFSGEAKADLHGIRDNIRKLVEDVRRICSNLRPPTIDSLGLKAAIQSHTNAWSERVGIPVQLSFDLHTERLPEETELSIFRIIQESLNNINQHTSATNVEISLHSLSPRALMLSIADNGAGLPDDFDFVTMGTEGHYGLLGISERVALLRGHVRFVKREGGGLIIQAEIPHPRAPQRHNGTTFSNRYP